jgi:hypothetical protein
LQVQSEYPLHHIPIDQFFSSDHNKKDLLINDSLKYNYSKY